MNLSASVYHRLKAIALKKGRPTQEVLIYYAIERFLYRLGISPYNNSFLLKGGLLLMVWNPMRHRPTVDIDLLAHTSNSIANVSRVLNEILSSHFQDGIEFDFTSLNIGESQIETEYTGLVVRFTACLHSAKLPLRIDLGFNDKVFPKPAKINYPTLLDFPKPELRGYTPETMIAEKLDAMIKLGLANTRMKDFYDIKTILDRFQINQQQMAPIIRGVFQNRKTALRELPTAFSESFYNAPKTIERWNAFLKSIGHDPMSLKEVILEMKDFFLPILPINPHKIND